MDVAAIQAWCGLLLGVACACAHATKPQLPRQHLDGCVIGGRLVPYRDQHIVDPEAVPAWVVDLSNKRAAIEGRELKISWSSYAYNLPQHPVQPHVGGAAKCDVRRLVALTRYKLRACVMGAEVIPYVDEPFDDAQPLPDWLASANSNKLDQQEVVLEWSSYRKELTGARDPSQNQLAQVVGACDTARLLRLRQFQLSGCVVTGIGDGIVPYAGEIYETLQSLPKWARSTDSGSLTGREVRIEWTSYLRPPALTSSFDPKRDRRASVVGPCRAERLIAPISQHLTGCVKKGFLIPYAGQRVTHRLDRPRWIAAPAYEALEGRELRIEWRSYIESELPSDYEQNEKRAVDQGICKSKRLIRELPVAKARRFNRL